MKERDKERERLLKRIEELKNEIKNIPNNCCKDCAEEGENNFYPEPLFYCMIDGHIIEDHTKLFNCLIFRNKYEEIISKEINEIPVPNVNPVEIVINENKKNEIK